MNRRIIALAVGFLFAAASPLFAQPGAGGKGGPKDSGRNNSEEMKKLLAEIEKLQAEIKEAEAQILKAQQGRKEEPRKIQDPNPLPGGGERPKAKNPSSPGGVGGGFGSGGGGFGSGGGGGFPPVGGFGPGSGFGGGVFGGGGLRGASDVKALEAQLDQLHQAAKMIAERTKDVEARLKQAKEEEARAAKTPRSVERKVDPRASSDVEKRLDRIEQMLDEIQRELRRKK
jgi:DNA repair exonuclease SbcCD ATPase subunit